MTVSKEEFQAYEMVRASGETNMLNLKVVCELSGLSAKKALEIMKTYSQIRSQYPEVREE